MRKPVYGILIFLGILAVAPTTTVQSQGLAKDKVRLDSGRDWSRFFPKIPGCGIKTDQVVTYDDGYGQVGRYQKSVVAAGGVIDTAFITDDPDFYDCGNIWFRLWLPNKTAVKPANLGKKTSKELRREKKRSEKQAKEFAKILSLLGRNSVPPPEKIPVTIKGFSGSVSTWFPRSECVLLTLEQMRPTTTIELWISSNLQVTLSLRTGADQAKLIAESIEFEELMASSKRLSADWGR